jgi:hypothetical protein
MKNTTKDRLRSILLLLVLYLFFSLLNWTFKTNEWGGVSIFFFALCGIIIITKQITGPKPLTN